MKPNVGVVRITGAKGFLIPEVYALLHKAFATNSLCKDPSMAIEELAMQVARQDVATYVGFEDNECVSMFCAQWSRSALNNACVVIHLYNGGGPAMRAALVREVVSYAKAGGFDTIIGVDANDKPRGFAKVFSAAGEPVFKGEMYAFDMSGSLV